MSMTSLAAFSIMAKLNWRENESSVLLWGFYRFSAFDISHGHLVRNNDSFTLLE